MTDVWQCGAVPEVMLFASKTGIALAEMLQFVDDWLANADPAVRESFAAAADGYPIENLRLDLKRFVVLVGSVTAKSCSNPSSDESRSGRA
jgi:hypothetical protein